MVRSSYGPIACWILVHTSFLVTWSLCEMRSILRKHLISMACILLWSSAVKVNDSQAYRVMMWQGSASDVSWNWEKYSCHSKLVSTLSMLLLSVLSWRVSQAWNAHQLLLILRPINHHYRFRTTPQCDWVQGALRSTVVALRKSDALKKNDTALTVGVLKEKQKDYALTATFEHKKICWTTQNTCSLYDDGWFLADEDLGKVDGQFLQARRWL